jgi:small subunit ribosomal protein S27Ae
MAKKKPKNKRPSKKWEKYSIKSGKLERKKICPKCGEATFLAEHKDRTYCGKCHLTEFVKKQTNSL